jgi:cytochrome bd-type quinol oxidase subunit 2
MNDKIKRLALAYGLVTGLLFVMILLSGRCWSFQNTHGLSNMAQRDACVYIWMLAVALLGVSQIAFIVLATRAERGAARTLILVVANVIVLAIVLFAAALAQMPS